MAVNYTPEEVSKAREVIRNEGIKMRYQVAGKEYVDRALKAADNDFARSMQEVSQEHSPRDANLDFVRSVADLASAVRQRSLLGQHLDPSRPRTEDPQLAQPRDALRAEPEC